MKLDDSGNLVPANRGNQLLFENFKKTIQKNQPVYVMFDATESTGTKAQKNILNLNIRKIAESQGLRFQEVKQMIKERSGLGHKSTEDCSKDELSLIIEEVKAVCDAVDIPFIGL